ncbi:MAG: carboxylating nicotinate-nucleotide diphosphorylase [Proteobacteria bacterium]|nr:carboxylating nicotinate-nucleotide diphosphorylase [Pseudomonadota bacterium]
MTTESALDGFLRGALEEDLGENGDLTSQSVIPDDAIVVGALVAREAGFIAGLDVALRVFTLVDPEVEVTRIVTHGSRVEPGHDLAVVAGPARSLLAAERLALNLLGQLSGVATSTRALVDRVAGTKATIIDTRKTVPGMRSLQKAAVLAGGGGNHRMGLYDAVLIKDNHIAAAGSAAAAVTSARAYVGPDTKVEVEIDSVDDLDAVIEAGADIVMLDNMDPETMRAAVELAAGRCVLEASGGITLETVRAVAETGVDWISVGWITHSAPALDVALDFEA